MQADTTKTPPAFPRLFARTAGYGCLILLPMAALFNWGRDQAFPPTLLEKKLKVGMTIAEVEYSLALAPGSTARYSSRNAADCNVVKLSDSGVGAWLVPQNVVTLLFDHDDRLEKCIYEIVWRCDEVNLPLDLPKAVHVGAVQEQGPKRE